MASSGHYFSFSPARVRTSAQAEDDLTAISDESLVEHQKATSRPEQTTTLKVLQRSRMLRKVCRIRTNRISSRGSEMCTRRVEDSNSGTFDWSILATTIEETIVEVGKHLPWIRKPCDRHCPSLHNDGNALHLYQQMLCIWHASTGREPAGLTRNHRVVGRLLVRLPIDLETGPISLNGRLFSSYGGG